MTGREWKPGDVAMLAGEVVIRVAYSGGREDHAFIDGGGRHWRHEDDTAHPLVVIDPEDREAVERLLKVLCGSGAFTGLTKDSVSKIQAALREFANPKPPKPEEPTGLGAVVEDGQGHRWVRWKVMERRPWRRDYGVDPDGQGGTYGTYAYWQDIDAVRVLSEGVQP